MDPTKTESAKPYDADGWKKDNPDWPDRGSALFLMIKVGISSKGISSGEFDYAINDAAVRELTNEERNFLAQTLRAAASSVEDRNTKSTPPPEDNMEDKAHAPNPTVLKEVIDHLSQLASATRRDSDGYKDMFKASEHGIRGLLDKLNDEMMSLVLDVCEVIEAKTGRAVSNDLFYFLLGQAFFREFIEHDISRNEGICCSVDKARELAKKFALSEIMYPPEAK